MRGPAEPAAFQSFRIERHPQPIMPKDLQRITTFAAEDVKIAGLWIAPQRLLNLQRQTIHAAAHVGHTRGQPDMNPGRRRERTHRYAYPNSYT